MGEKRLMNHCLLCLLCQAGVVLVEALLDARHEVLVVVLQPYDARPRRPYCDTSATKLSYHCSASGLP